MVLLDSSSPEQFTAISGYAGQHAVMRRALALAPTLSRFGLGRVVAAVAPSHLSAPDAERLRALTAGARGARSMTCRVVGAAGGLRAGAGAHHPRRPAARRPDRLGERAADGRVGRGAGPARGSVQPEHASGRRVDPRRPARGRARRSRLGARHRRRRRGRPEHPMTTRREPAPLTHTTTTEGAHHVHAHPGRPGSDARRRPHGRDHLEDVLGAARRRPRRPDPRGPRHLGRQHRAALDRALAEPRRQPAAVARHGVPDDVRRRPPARRPDRRPAVEATRLPDRARPVHGGLAAQRVRRHRRPARRDPRDPGAQRRAAHPVGPRR